MRKSLTECQKFAREIIRYYPKILPPLEVIAESRRLANGFMPVTRLGVSRGGHVLECFRDPRPAPRSALLYGFPDPGEAVGGTGLLCLLRALREGHPFLAELEYSWNFIPCLNLDDQPEGGRALAEVRKTSAQEVDWLVRNPRPETSALLSLATELHPRFVFPLHDEWHCREEVPCYFPVSHALPAEVCEGLRSLFRAAGLPISGEIADPVMGAGFLAMSSAEDYPYSTFCEFSKQGGLVFIAEVPFLPQRPDSDLIAAQLASGLFVAANAVP